MAAFAVKSATGPIGVGDVVSLDERTMYGGKEVAAGDEVFVFDSENQGGSGLCARGTVLDARRSPARHGNPTIRVAIEVRVDALATRALGRDELRPVRDLDDGEPASEVARKLYRQPTNKVVRLAPAEAAFLAERCT